MIAMKMPSTNVT